MRYTMPDGLEVDTAKARQSWAEPGTSRKLHRTRRGTFYIVDSASVRQNAKYCTSLEARGLLTVWGYDLPEEAEGDQP